VLRERGYVRLEKKRLHPEDKGRLVTAFLEAFFSRYVEYGFTANLEESLDKISAGEIDWKEVLRDFWRDFISAIEATKELRVTNVLDALNEILAPHIFPPKPDGSEPRTCPSCSSGQLSLKIGKFGAFIGCSNYPDCRYTRQISTGEGTEREAVPAEGILLGHDSETGTAITRRDGRFGPYVQLGESDGEEKPRRASVPKNWDPASVDLDMALRLLSLPREVGLHPETGQPIVANFGRYGPFILHDGKYATLESADEVFTVGINRAVDLLAKKKARPGRASAAALKVLGDHPEGGKVQVMSGRYGPYVKWNKVNATLPKDKSPESITFDEALELVAAKSGKGKSRKPTRKRKAKAEEPVTEEA
jgi:DNA topoisomerase-1